MRVVVADDDGASSHVWFNVTVNVPPVAKFDVLLNGAPADEGEVHTRQMLTFDASNSTDPSGVVRYEWDFGDGYTQGGMLANHAYELEGNYTVTLKVTDGHGATDVSTYTIEVTEAPVTEEPLVSGTAIAIVIALVVTVLLVVVALLWIRHRGELEEGPGV